MHTTSSNMKVGLPLGVAFFNDAVRLKSCATVDIFWDCASQSYLAGRSYEAGLKYDIDIDVVIRASSSEHFIPKPDIWPQCRPLFSSRALTCSSTI